MTKFEANKEYKTRDGRKARVYAVDGAGDYCIHGALYDSYEWKIRSWTKNGQISIVGTDSCSDLMPNVREFWINVYGDFKGGAIHKSKIDALASASDICLETIKVREILEEEE